jgi:hypothetical protein
MFLPLCIPCYSRIERVAAALAQSMAISTGVEQDVHRPGKSSSLAGVGGNKQDAATCQSK